MARRVPNRVYFDQGENTSIKSLVADIRHHDLEQNQHDNDDFQQFRVRGRRLIGQYLINLLCHGQ
jgi:hypothetical protein